MQLSVLITGLEAFVLIRSNVKVGIPNKTTEAAAVRRSPGVTAQARSPAGDSLPSRDSWVYCVARLWKVGWKAGPANSSGELPPTHTQTPHLNLHVYLHSDWKIGSLYLDQLPAVAA